MCIVIAEIGKLVKRKSPRWRLRVESGLKVGILRIAFLSLFLGYEDENS